MKYEFGKFKLRKKVLWVFEEVLGCFGELVVFVEGIKIVVEVFVGLYEWLE